MFTFASYAKHVDIHKSDAFEINSYTLKVYRFVSGLFPIFLSEMELENLFF